MKVQILPLQERLNMLAEGYGGHPEYFYAVIHHFAELPLTHFLADSGNGPFRLSMFLGIPLDTLRAMNYQQFAVEADKRFPAISADLQERVLAVLSAPFMDSGGKAQKKARNADRAQQRTPLAERLRCCGQAADTYTLFDFYIAGLLPWLDSLADPDDSFCTDMYVKYLTGCDEKTFREVICECTNMDGEARRTVLYNLLIKPFALLRPSP